MCQRSQIVYIKNKELTMCFNVGNCTNCLSKWRYCIDVGEVARLYLETLKMLGRQSCGKQATTNGMNAKQHKTKLSIYRNAKHDQTTSSASKPAEPLSQHQAGLLPKLHSHDSQSTCYNIPLLLLIDLYQLKHQQAWILDRGGQ